jgi:transposase
VRQTGTPTEPAAIPTAVAMTPQLCPRNDESAGKRRSTRLRKGDPWLKTLLVQCVWAARRKKGSYFNTQFYRLRGRRGPKKAACAVAASLLTTIYHLLKDGTQFEDLGADHFDRRSKDMRAKRLVTQLAKLGSEAKLTPAMSCFGQKPRW